LKPWFGATVLFSVVGVVTVADFTFTALGVFAETVVRIATLDVALFTTGLTLDVAFLATGLTLDVAFFTTRLTLDVALFTTRLTLDVAFFATGFFAAGFFTAGFFTAGFLTTAVLGAVRRRVSGLVADSAGLIQERWADDFSLRSGLILDEVVGVFLFGTSGIIAHFAVWLVGSGDGGGGGISGRHCIRFDCFWLEALLVADLRKNISIFFQMHRIKHIIIFSNSVKLF
jgi:hypothetical protein